MAQIPSNNNADPEHPLPGLPIMELQFLNDPVEKEVTGAESNSETITPVGPRSKKPVPLPHAPREIGRARPRP